jgi:hypothetical protein
MRFRSEYLSGVWSKTEQTALRLLSPTDQRCGHTHLQLDTASDLPSGLSTTCTICNHKTHVKCFRTHFPSASTCPACSCRCLLDHGTSAPSISFVQAPSSPSISRAQGRGSISPVSPGTREGRLNYANLANLAGMVNMLGPIRESSDTRTDALGFSPENTSGFAERTGAGAGVAQPPGGVVHPRPEGLLARARGLTAEGLLHWSRMEDR